MELTVWMCARHYLVWERSEWALALSRGDWSWMLHEVDNSQSVLVVCAPGCAAV
jgi:hypothetical protein